MLERTIFARMFETFACLPLARLPVTITWGVAGTAGLVCQVGQMDAVVCVGAHSLAHRSALNRLIVCSSFALVIKFTKHRHCQGGQLGCVGTCWRARV